MPERSTVNQGVQVGDESVYGTAVVADTRLSALSIMASPSMDFQRFRPAGNKFNTIAALNREFTEADLEGALTYTECIYPFSSIFGAAAITSPDAVNAPALRQWLFEVAATAADNPVSFTVQRGDGTLRETFAGFVVNDLNLNFSRDGIEMDGSGFGKAITSATGAMDAVTTTPTLEPVLATQVSVYADAYPASPTEANITSAFGVTKLTRVISANLSFGNRYSQVWALDAAQTGNVAVVEVPVEFGLELVMQADATGMARLATARAGDPQLIRIEAIGKASGTLTFRLRIDVLGRITGGGGFDDNDGVQVVTWNFDQMYDATWTRAMRVEVRNETAAL